MPRTKINFQNCVIYKLVCSDLKVKDLYVGHTTNFVDRKACHKSHCNNANDIYHNLKVYKFIRANGGCAIIVNSIE